MALLDLLFPKQKVRFFDTTLTPVTLDVLALVTLDASLSETYSTQSEITEHPVESGVDIADHIRTKPKEIRIEGVVSNHPAILGANIPVGLGRTPVGLRAETAYANLVQAQADAKKIGIRTSLRDYNNMIITSLDLTRDANNGNVARMSITLREVFTIDLFSLKTPTPIVSAAKLKSVAGKAGLAVKLAAILRGTVTSLVATSAGAAFALRKTRTFYPGGTKVPAATVP